MPIMATVGIFGSCVTRDAFEFASEEHNVATYVARTTIRSALSAPVDGSFLPTPLGKPKFEERCVQVDLEKTHFRELAAKPFDVLLIDLIDERHSVLESEGAIVCNSVALTRFASANGLDMSGFSRRMSLEPLLIEDTVAKIPEFARRLAAILGGRPAVLHEATWASHYIAVDGSTRPFDDQPLIQKVNSVLDLYYAAVRREWPGISAIRMSPDLHLATEDHRWGLQPFHYAAGYYQAFVAQLGQAIDRQDSPAA